MFIILSLLLSEDNGQDHRYDQILDDLRKIAISCIVVNIFFLMSSITSNLTMLRFDVIMITTDYNFFCQ